MARKRDGDAILQDVKVQVKSNESPKKAPQAPKAETSQNERKAPEAAKTHSDTEYIKAKAQLEELRQELREKSLKEQDSRTSARKILPGEDLLEVETVPRTFRRKLSVKRLERSKSFTSWLFSNREL